jgi:hypothetical protein
MPGQPNREIHKHPFFFRTMLSLILIVEEPGGALRRLQFKTFVMPTIVPPLVHTTAIGSSHSRAEFTAYAVGMERRTPRSASRI